mmetsp:Transcript_26609/g.106612  ORF Transcript_26609/g.106612 Transcript_26609/m.106612 type:complete len:81 (+) Transcript_26609:249-491(+)
MRRGRTSIPGDKDDESKKGRKPTSHNSRQQQNPTKEDAWARLQDHRRGTERGHEATKKRQRETTTNKTKCVPRRETRTIS